MAKQGGIKVKLYRYKCIGCGYCISLLPNVWAYSKYDGKITHSKTPSFEEDDQIIQIEPFYSTEVKQSEDICPVKAIKKV
jgi:ferredoxin